MDAKVGHVQQVHRRDEVEERFYLLFGAKRSGRRAEGSVQRNATCLSFIGDGEDAGEARREGLISYNLIDFKIVLKNWADIRL